MEFMMPQFLVGLVFAAMCAMIAHSRGRSAVGWFFLGCFFNCFALIILLVVDDLKVRDEKDKTLRRENRRLREQLKKDRAVADARHGATEHRLAAHDRALGVDTASPALAASSAPAPKALPAADLVETQWYYLDGDRARQGPLDFPDLKRLWRESTVGARTLLWTRSFADWTHLDDVPGLEDELRA